jgi:type II secretion system protein G
LTVAGSGVFPGRVPRGIKDPAGKVAAAEGVAARQRGRGHGSQQFKEKHMRAQVRKAFTLVEILIVVVILGILAAIVVPQFTTATQDAQGGNIQTQLSTIQQAMELYKAKNNAYADISANWDALTTGGYLKSPPKNPVTGSALVADGTYNAATGQVTGGAGTDGWQWDATAGVMGAVSFNEETQKVTGTPGD